MEYRIQHLLSTSLATLCSLPIVAAELKLDQGGPGTSKLPEPPAGHSWVLDKQLSDEFEGKALDTIKWQARHPYWSGRSPSRFDPANVAVSGGMLWLRATTDISKMSEVAKPESDNWVRSSCVTSLKASAHHGYHECRFRASKLSMTSSFWLQGGGGEIDVVEQMGAPGKHPKKSHQMLMNTHFFSRKNGKKTDQATPKTWTMPTGSADEFHTYGVWWKDENHAWFYHNGVKIAELDFAAPFTKPMYLFLDTEVFVWDGLPSIESLKDPKKNSMHVDWVRSWKLEPEEK